MFWLKSNDKQNEQPQSTVAVVQDRVSVQKLCIESMKICPNGEALDEIQNGLDFYKYFFTNFPDLRVYFKGAEKFTADDVQKSERFQKQGQRILLAVHVCTKIFDDVGIFHGYIREMVNRHRQFKMAPELWNAFWAVWVGYLESKKKAPLDDATKKAWMDLGAEFAHIARSHLKNCGLPH